MLHRWRVPPCQPFPALVSSCVSVSIPVCRDLDAPKGPVLAAPAYSCWWMHGDRQLWAFCPKMEHVQYRCLLLGAALLGLPMPWGGCVWMETFPHTVWPNWDSFSCFLQEQQKPNATNNICFCFKGKERDSLWSTCMNLTCQILFLTLF